MQRSTTPRSALRPAAKVPAKPSIKVDRIHPRTVGDQMKRTVEIVGKAIRDGATYLPIRQHAAEVCARGAAPKDFPGQLRALYADFVKRWRYVRDPQNAEMVAASGPALWNLVYGGGTRQGVGDCDDACAAFSAAAMSCGFAVRLVTSVPLRHAHDPRLRKIPGHIYPEIFVKPQGWIPADPVVWPKHGIGYAAPAIARYRFDLWGRPIGATALHGAEGREEDGSMYGRTDDVTGASWQDYGLAEHGYALGYSEGEEYGAAPLDWTTYGLEGFGASADRIYDASTSGMLAEVSTDEYGLARTPMIEMAGEDIAYVRAYGRPFPGMAALGDDGAVYQWQPAQGLQLGGFFKKIFKGVKKLFKGAVKGVMKLAQKGLKFAKKLIAKLPGGKYLVKFLDKVHKIAMKLVKPLAKIIGPAAKFLGPVAAMIPGYGPVIAVALRAAGTVSKLMTKYGIKQTKKGTVIPKSKKSMDAFQAELKKHAETTRSTLKEKRAKMDPKHIPAGTPEHVVALRALGLKMPPTGAIAPAKGAKKGSKKGAKRGAEEASPVEFAWY